MAYETDDAWGTPERRTLAYTRRDTQRLPAPSEPPTAPLTSSELGQGSIDAGRRDAFGPEAHVRARTMDYELTTRIQQESPYIREEVVEHKIHDYRLYIGIWVVAGLSGVAAFLTFSVVHLIITAVAVVFGLISSPGRQRCDD